MTHRGCLLWEKVVFHPFIGENKLIFGWAKTQLVGYLIFILLFLISEPWAEIKIREETDLNKCCMKSHYFSSLCIFLSDASTEDVIVCQKFLNFPQICWYARRTHRIQKFLLLWTQFITANWYNTKLAKGKVQGTKSGGNQSRASKILLPVELHKVCLISLATMHENACKVFSTREAPLCFNENQSHKYTMPREFTTFLPDPQRKAGVRYKLHLFA